MRNLFQILASLRGFVDAASSPRHANVLAAERKEK